MADEEGVYKITADTASAIRDIDKVTSAVADLNEQTKHTDKNLNQSERALVQAGAAAKKYAGELQAAEAAARRFKSNTNLKGFTIFGKDQDAGIASNVPRAFQAYSRGMTQAQKDSQAFTAQLRVQREETFRQASAQQQMAADVRNTENAFSSMSNARYALFDVARALTLISVATAGVAIAAIKTEADFENLLISVKRTAGAAGAEWDDLRQSIIGLTTEIPGSIEDVTGIATLAGQLGIATDQIDEFTESVFKFASTTDVTAEDAAEKIGRVAQLAGAGAGEYDNLAASIYQVGITSVSTESDILAVTEQISVSARQAGFAAEETVALASALASLGVAPERARGSIQRVFNIITNAADNGSETLQDFARLTGQSAEDFAASWNGSPQEAFQDFLAGLGRAGDAGENMNNILADLGISAVRDTDALKRLAQNTDVYATAISEANEGWVDGSVFADGYGEVADTLNNQLIRLVNTLKAIVEAAQDNEGLKAFVGVLQEMAENVLYLAESDLGQWMTGIAIGLGVVVGGLSLLGAGLAIGTASIYAMITALRFMTEQQTANIGLTGLARTALIDYAVAARGASAASLQNASSARIAAVAMGAVDGSAKAATVSMQALRATIASTGIGAALVAIGYGFNKMAEASREATEQAAERMDGLSSAVKEDAVAWAELDNSLDAPGFRIMSTEVETNTEEVVLNKDAVNDAFGSTVQMSDAVSEATGKLSEQNIALGKNTQEWVNNNAATSFLASFGEDPQAQAEGLRGLIEAQERYGVSVEEINKAVFEGNKEFLTRTQRAITQSYANDELTTSELKSAEALERVVQNGQDQITTMENYATATDNATGSNDLFGSSLGETEDAAYDASLGIDEVADSMTDVVDNIFAVVNSQGAFIEAMNNLGASLYNNGTDFSVYTEAGRANLDALQKAFNTAVIDANGNADVLNNSVNSIVSSMEAAGVSGARNIQVVRDMLRLAVSEINSAQPILSNPVSNGAINPNSVFARSGQVNTQPPPLLRRNTSRLVDQDELNRIKQSMVLQNQLADQVQVGFNNAADAAKNMGGASKNAGDAAKKAGDQAAEAAKKAKEEYEEAAQKIKDDAADAIAQVKKDAEEAVRTLTDYISNVSGVLSKAFDFRFGFSQARDDAADSLQGIRDSFTAAERSVRDMRQSITDLKSTLKGLSADRGTLDYFLGVAVEYGDVLREQQIRADIAKNESDQASTRDDLADATKDLRKEQKFLDKDLKGSSEESREHREMMEELTLAYQQQILEYAGTGASIEKVTKYAQNLRKQFQVQYTQLGYNKSQMITYERALEDVILVIQKMPRSITTRVDANTRPAEVALDEYLAEYNKTTVAFKTAAIKRGMQDDLNELYRDYNNRKTVTYKTNASTSGARGDLSKVYSDYNGKTITMKARVNDQDVDAAANKQYYLGRAWEANRILQNYGGPNPGPLIADLKYWRDKVASVKDYWVGGYTGDTGTRTPVGTVHGKEFVFDAKSTAAIGPANLQAMMDSARRGSFGMMGMQPNITVSGGGGMSDTMNLSAMSVQMIANAVRPVLEIDGQRIGNVTSKSYQQMASRGAN